MSLCDTRHVVLRKSRSGHVKLKFGILCESRCGHVKLWIDETVGMCVILCETVYSHVVVYECRSGYVKL